MKKLFTTIGHIAKTWGSFQLKSKETTLLVGNVFPLTLISRKVLIEPISLEEFTDCATHAKIYSFWGHSNTLAAACMACGVDLTPRTPRAVVTTSENGLPMLDGLEFERCFLVSPRYRQAFRPAIGEEVSLNQIAFWQILKMTWMES